MIQLAGHRKLDQKEIPKPEQLTSAPQGTKSSAMRKFGAFLATLLDSVCSNLDNRLRRIEKKDKETTQALKDLKYLEAILRNKAAQETARDQQLLLLGCDRRFFKELYNKHDA